MFCHCLDAGYNNHAQLSRYSDDFTIPWLGVWGFVNVNWDILVVDHLICCNTPAQSPISTNMATQTGITIAGPNEPYTIVDTIARPSPGPKQVLVKSLYVGINPV